MISDPEKQEGGIFVVGHDRTEVSGLVAQLRETGYRCLYDPFQASMKSQFRQANKASVSHVLILGEEEIANKTVSVKSMRDSKQVNLPVDSAMDYLAQELAPKN